MPSYGMPVDTNHEEVGCAFNKDIDSNSASTASSATLLGENVLARAWGCENLSEMDHVIKIVDAGCDQVGGESKPELMIEAVRSGLVSEDRIDESVRRVLRGKFRQGLFDDKRFVDADQASVIVGNPDFMRMAKDAQQSPSLADVAYETRSGGFQAKFHSGSLELTAEEVERLYSIISQVTYTIIDVYMERPAVLTPLVEAQMQARAERMGAAVTSSMERVGGSALMANFGAADDAYLDVCFGVGVLPLAASCHLTSRARMKP
ncbi:hypothetical protein B0I35DRAFT_485438 [Stachybotrys elegans]|uniref:Uncharacterized protein n=1 Tax=Stachybotrys elegans TaxID=80388 RepID=A0A8K0SFX2_9HYPO|nr:hypothetical protein B0I35DRAFT_485438 [Stachybotrys elegans]